MARTKIELERLIRGSMGEIKADLVITNSKLVNVYSGEILDGMEIAVIDRRICYVGPSAQHTRGDTTEIFDAHGLYVSPGFIDGHTRIGHYAHRVITRRSRKFYCRGTRGRRPSVFEDFAGAFV